MKVVLPFSIHPLSHTCSQHVSIFTWRAWYQASSRLREPTSFLYALQRHGPLAPFLACGATMAFGPEKGTNLSLTQMVQTQERNLRRATKCLKSSSSKTWLLDIQVLRSQLPLQSIAPSAGNRSSSLGSERFASNRSEASHVGCISWLKPTQNIRGLMALSSLFRDKKLGKPM